MKSRTDWDYSRYTPEDVRASSLTAYFNCIFLILLNALKSLFAGTDTGPGFWVYGRVKYLP